MSIDLSAPATTIWSEQLTTYLVDQILTDAINAGAPSVNARCSEDPLTGEWTWHHGRGEVVLVEVGYRSHQSAAVSFDVLPITDVARLHYAGVIIDTIRSAHDRNTYVYDMAAARTALRPFDGEDHVTYQIVMIDRRGSRSAFASRHQLPDGDSLAVELHQAILDQAAGHDKARIDRASDRLGADTSDTVLASTAFEHLSAFEEHRRLDQGSGPMLEWSIEVQRVVGGNELYFDTESSAAAPEPTAKHERRDLFRAYVGAITTEAFGRADERSAGSSRQHQSLTSHRQGSTQTETHLRPATATEWSDPTGNLAAALADGDLSLEEALSLADLSTLELVKRWCDAGLDQREVTVLLLSGAGWSQQEIGDVIKRDRSTVSRLITSARKKV